MKRYLIFLCLFLFVTLLVACGKITPATSTEIDQTSAEATESATDTQAKVTESSEQDTTYPDILYDTTPITGEIGTPYRANWNPYLLSPLIEEDLTKAFEDAITAILNRRLSVKYDDLDTLLAVKDNLFYEFPPAALCEISADEETLTLRFSYRHDRETHLEKVAAFGDKVEEILRDYLVFGDGEAEKAIMLYHAVAYTVDYIKTNYEPWQINAYYALTENRAICYSFSDAYNYLLRQVGVEAWLVRSYRPTDRAKHGWSLIRVGEDYYHCDTTWEYNFISGVGFYYFAMNDKRRANAISLEDATVGLGSLQKPIPYAANGSRFDKMAGDKYHAKTWTIDREKKVLVYNGKEYPYS